MADGVGVSHIQRGREVSGQRIGVNDLPARPDLATGFPRPPHAPGWVRSSGNRAEERDPGRKPNPPPGQGIVVTWYLGNRRQALRAAAMWAPIMLIFFSIFNGFAWTSVWLIWATFALGVYGCYRAALSRPCSVGADWVAQGRRWVRTYELTAVSFHSRIGGARLRMRDRDGHRMTVKIEDLFGDRVMWDLVYNGILHSVIAGGARATNRVHLDLHVPRPLSGAASDPG